MPIEQSASNLEWSTTEADLHWHAPLPPSLHWSWGEGPRVSEPCVTMRACIPDIPYM